MTPNNSQLRDQLVALGPLHFVGALGSGMRPLAEFVSAFDVPVSGSDRKTSDVKANFTLVEEATTEDFERLSLAKTVVYSSAIGASHPSLIESKRRGLTLYHRSELLAMISKSYKTIAIAGTHGKTTTSAMVSHVLRALGEDPSWIIGAPFASGEDSFHRGNSPWLVIEADESDGSFLRYQPFISIVTNVDADHMDHYQTFDRLKDGFQEFAGKTNPQGTLICCGDHAVAQAVSHAYPGQRLTYGFAEHNSLKARDYSVSGLTSSASLQQEGQKAHLTIPMPGRHNVLNALAAIGVAHALHHPLEQAAKTLSNFPGVHRRLQRYPSKRALIFDDYAHNPGKIASCIAGLREAFPERRLVVCFQPHRYSRLSSLYVEFMTCFRAPNICVLALPVYAAGEAAIKGFESERLASDIAKLSSVESFSAPTLKEAYELLKSKVDPNKDVVVTIGAGDVWQLALRLSQEL